MARRLAQPVTIELRLTIDAVGAVVDAQSLGVKGDLNTQLARVAVDAARRWKYTPATLGGQPVLSTTTVRFVFKPLR
jgi:TonB family protein